MKPLNEPKPNDPPVPGSKPDPLPLDPHAPQPLDPVEKNPFGDPVKPPPKSARGGDR